MNMYSQLVSCEEEKDSPDEQWSEKGLTATVKLKVPWAQRTIVVAEIMGSLQQYPRLPWTEARCSGASVVPYPGQRVSLETGFLTDASSYEYALCTFKYESGGKDKPETSELVSEELNITTEFLTLDPSAFFWDPLQIQPLSDGEAPGKIVRGLEYSLTYHKRTSLPDSIYTLPGCCNSDTYMTKLLGKSFAPETLLYNPPRAQRRIMSNPTEPPAWTLSYTFAWRPWGWNKFWNPRTGNFDVIFDTDGNEYKNYPPRTFTGKL